MVGKNQSCSNQNMLETNVHTPFTPTLSCTMFDFLLQKKTSIKNWTKKRDEKKGNMDRKTFFWFY